MESNFSLFWSILGFLRPLYDNQNPRYCEWSPLLQNCLKQMHSKQHTCPLEPWQWISFTWIFWAPEYVFGLLRLSVGRPPCCVRLNGNRVLLMSWWAHRTPLSVPFSSNVFETWETWETKNRNSTRSPYVSFSLATILKDLFTPAIGCGYRTSSSQVVTGDSPDFGWAVKPQQPDGRKGLTGKQLLGGPKELWSGTRRLWVVCRNAASTTKST